MSDKSTLQKIITMLEMQNAMNTKVNDEWFNQGYEWYRAIWVECAEMLDHYGWKWWKHQEIDREQVVLELVDIFHFGLSCRIDGVKSYSQIAEQLSDELSEPTDCDSFPQALEGLAGFAISHKGFDANYFAACMRLIDLDFDNLFQSYVGKNTLNFFRQDHGYKDGSYVKVWDGKEDNEHLMDVVKQLDCDHPDFAKQVYQGLAAKYPTGS